MSKHNILYVEDSELVGRFVVDALKLSGVDVTLVVSGNLALETLKTRADEFALVLCDQSLPDISGLELMAQIREVYPTLRLALTTGFVDADIEQRARAFDALLPKPFDTDQVLALLKPGGG